MNHKEIIFAISILSIVIIYYMYTRFYGLFAIYNCFSTEPIWKLLNGKLSSCIRVQPTTCKAIDKYSIYGFCYDPDYYGIGVGEEKGPYGYDCNDWVFDSTDCYPETCELANVSNRFGWCVEKGRAYKGSSCGLDKKYGISCKNWIWNDPSKCPKKCIKPINPKKKVIPKCPKKKQIPRCPKKDDICLCD
jgi:hypothetical protein